MKKKKLVAPIVVTGLTILYYVLYFGFLMVLVSGIWKWLLGLFPLAFSILSVAVCIERISEIKK